MKAVVVPQVLFVALASLGAFLFVRSARSDHLRLSCSAECELQPAYAGRNRLAPDFELPNATGRPVRLSSYRGQTVVLNFWTQSCGPCLKELPSLAELAVLGRDSGFVVVTVSADEGPEEVSESLDQALGGQEPPFEILFDPELSVIKERYGTTLYPETWLIDPKGVIRARYDGERNWSSALARDVIETVRQPIGCLVEFDRGVPLAPYAGLCPAR